MGVDAWIEELGENLSKKGGPGIDSVTFPTTMVSFTRDEKLFIHSLFKEKFGDVVSVEDASDSARKAVGSDYFDHIETKVSETKAVLDDQASGPLKGLRE